ncbi:adaptor protein MecA [Lacticaseibacillus paracasei]|uniref:adaptor protein MecA n=1 Tax=Lacticaseibacillus paracasei TaxID=1597 RepID=UPI003C2EA5FA
MEMERINANTIRVMLGNDDLAQRGITVLDLLGNHKQIESFFYSILDEVDKDHTFATNEAVTFQVMPSQSGLELLISKSGQKNDDSAADQTDDEGTDTQVPDYIRQQLQGLDASDQQDHQAVDEGGYIDADKAPQTELVLKLKDFEDFISLADTLRLEGGKSDLYRYKNAYYLVLTFYPNEISSNEAHDQMAVAMEFGDRSPLSSAVLSEYGKRLMETSALETARYYFK